MTEPSWQEWLREPRRQGWPARVRDLLPAELASACLVLHNDPAAESDLDASGFLSLARLDTLIEALAGAMPAPWLVAYWDGWSGIGPSLDTAFSGRVSRLELPLRAYLAIEMTYEELSAFSHAQRPYVGPSVVGDRDRSVLAIGDVDWSHTYLGFRTPGLRDAVAEAFRRRGQPGVEGCGGQTVVG